MLQNQFISPQELSKLHLDALLIRHPQQKPQATHASDTTVAKVIAQLVQGTALISSVQENADDLLDGKSMTESEKRLISNRKQKQLRDEINRELYSYNKNKQSEKQQNRSRRVLTNTEHGRFIKNMKKDNQKRKEMKQQREQLQEEARLKEMERQKRSSEEKRMIELEKRKDTIRENLKKMRQNHEKMVATQQQSRVLFHQIRKKKRLYQQMQQTQEERSLQKSRQIQKRMQQHRQQSKLDIKQLLTHQKSYMELRKQKAQTRQSSRVKLHSSQQNYKPPQHSHKLNSILEEQFRSRKKEEQNKKRIEEKLRKIAQYSTSVKERFKYQTPQRVKKNATEAEQQSVQSDRIFLRSQINRTQIGNEYLKQVKAKTKKRSKTEERYFNPESTTVQVERKQLKPRMSTLAYIPQNKRKEHIERMKKQQIQKMLNIDNKSSEAEKIERLKLADERLSIELRKREEQLKDNYSPEANSATLALLLGSIRAKLNLISNGHR